MKLHIEVETDLSTLDARDRVALGELVVALLTASDDEAAWHPMRRARLLLDRARLLAERDQ
jgi:hypothetical protein